MKNTLSDPLTLNNSTLSQLPDAIKRPTYDRARLTPGIVHIGVGNFHRAHQAWYVHQLMQQGEAFDWAIIGAGVRPNDTAMRDKLRQQDYLTTLIELAPDRRSAEIIGPMIDYIPVEVGNGPLIQAMADPAIRIVSLTVTEGGYYLDPATGGFDATHPDMVHDARHRDAPKTAFGAIVAALNLRRQVGIQPFTGQSCDNLQGNGRILRQTVVGLARLSNPALADWIDTQGAFPNAMVDCIVPATGSAERALSRDMGVVDNAPVAHENFRQWVIEDTFCMGRPNWNKVGVTFTDDVHPHELMKIRILNAGHQVIANVGEVLSIETIADCMAHPRIAAFFHKVQQDAIVPYVPAVPGMVAKDYVMLIDRRFSNPAIQDTARRVAFDGSSRHTGFVLPILRDALRAGGPVDGFALVEALWARMCFGTREDGSTIEPNDPHWQNLTTVAARARAVPHEWLAQSHIYGDLAMAQSFAQAFEKYLKIIWTSGALAAIESYLG